jgi:hypothetical protein
MEATSEKKGPPHGPVISRTIPLDVAVVRVTRWLNTIAAMPEFKGKPDSIPRAIYISFDDIEALKAEYPETDLKGIRMYFGLAGEGNPEPPGVKDIHGLIVPVFDAAPYRKHADLVINDPTNPNATSIYDFTAPCPVVCDFQSELYVPIS